MYDKDFKLKRKIKFSILAKIKEVKSGSDFVSRRGSHYERSYFQYKNYLGNLHIGGLQVLDNLVLIQFRKSLLEKDILPNFPTKDQFDKREKGFALERDSYYLIYNLEKGEEEIVKLTKITEVGFS